MYLLFVFFLSATSALDVVGWYIESVTPQIEIEDMPWESYTHFVVGAPIVDEHGFARCNKSDTTLAKFVALGKKYNTKIVWREGIPSEIVWKLLENASWADYKSQYLQSIGTAVKECEIDGIEFDYECPPTPKGRAGIVSDWEATQFTQFLADVKASMGKDKQISCDMGVWGVTRGSYPLMFKPWVNVSMVKAGAIDYINTMSYHYPILEQLFPWQKDAFILHDLWGLPKDKINIGVPYFFHNGTTQEPLWSQLSPLCKNLDAHATQCAGVKILSKYENYLIGKYAREAGFRGTFPWAANYDSIEHNNTMVHWLVRGLRDV